MRSASPLIVTARSLRDAPGPAGRRAAATAAAARGIVAGRRTPARSAAVAGALAAAAVSVSALDPPAAARPGVAATALSPGRLLLLEGEPVLARNLGDVGQRNPVALPVGIEDVDARAEDVDLDHLARLILPDDLRPVARIDLLGLRVEVEFVAEAALEPAAHPGELGRRQGKVLLLRHLERDRLEFADPGRTAERPPAHAHPAVPAGFVPDADLPQLDPGPEDRRQVLHQFPEVDPLLGGEVERDPVAVELVLDV